MTAERAEPQWITPTMAMTIHADQIRQHGGAAGIRDQGLLEAALGRPRNRWHYDPGADLPALAATYATAMAGTHPLIDGNKRTAFQVMYVFAGLNGVRIVASQFEVVQLMIAVAAGETEEDAVADWLRRHVEPR